MSDLLHRALGEIVQLDVAAGDPLWAAEADPNQLENAILNLAVNARDAMPNGGRLTITTSNETITPQRAAQHAGLLPGDYVVISVGDTGTGMTPQVISRAFEPFFTTKEVGRGTGLGLSQVYGFVKQSGGYVMIESAPGAGTTVRICLPRVLRAADEDKAAHMPHPVARLATVLVVEDDDDVRAYTVDCLADLGYRVLEASHGEAALRLMEEQPRPPDLLFTDVVMPGMSGRELADIARRRYPELKILYTSGYTRDAISPGGRLEPGIDMITKPFTQSSLAVKFRELLEPM
jgi:CheY-like chemotaxis protein